MVRIGSFILLMMIGACAGTMPPRAAPIAVYGPTVANPVEQRKPTVRLSPHLEERLDTIDQQIKSLRDDLSR